ncbi:hypothetical protein L2719_10905 [Shewanella schlegeliana]|uniref:Lipoprotein n=1 Tax=Shewanella schlegeliana TaxID=190308 RepID=A0ABS1T3P1_9GAMM|nr:hypothetical protein [Shewanella schlegeliana]MBL4915417.1 hypothetical protein [Shewanella schlegeliana]MCL1110059.1 hypothetical protein [Shewanella schlegeliana]
MYRITIFLCFCLLSACAQQQAFLTTQGVSQVKIEALTKQLNEQGWRVTQTNLPIPNEFTNATVAANPAQENQADIEQVVSTLELLGFSDPQTYKFAEGKHFYSIDNIGIYLRTGQTNLQPPSWLRSDDCIYGDALLAFNPNGQVTLEHEPTHTESDRLDSYVGVWVLDGSRLKINLSQGEQSYISSNITRRTWRGVSPAQLFTPIEKAKFSPLNCSFIIIEME